ncbi:MULTISPECIES: hypothetical protein [unclassified Streptomyces]|uniref:hypothetical protein n=1 Tax=unclassified Streptomyces TaxID=2593676 RepID=UPI003806B1B2
MKTCDWRPFLEPWSADRSCSPDARGPREWLGSPAAGEERVRALVEERLGIPLPRFAVERGRLHAVATGPGGEPR